MDIASALIVDDSKMARITLKKQLENREITVHLAETGEESLNFLKTNHPDIIFMDCLMPGIDGFKATQEIKSNPDTASIPVVMCTGKESDDDKQKAFASGAVGYMPKTSSLEPLNDILYEISHLDGHTNAPRITAAESVSTTESASTSMPASPDLSEITRIAEQSANTLVDSLKAQYSNDLNSKINDLSEQLEQKVIFTIESSLKDVHRYVDSQIEHLKQKTLPELKENIDHSLTGLISDSMNIRLEPLRQDFELFKSEMNQLDVESLVEQQTQQQLERSFQQNLPNYAAKIMEDEASRTLIEAMIQEQLSEHKVKLATLEQLLAEKNNSNSRFPSLLALLTGSSALLISIYQLLQ